MTDLRASLERLVPEPELASDWADVRRRAGRSRRPVVVLALAAAALALGATALAETLGHGFSDWLTGKPGRPTSERLPSDERALAPFPEEPELRELMRTRAGGRTFRLLGFRSDGAVCLRLVVERRGQPVMACAPVTELERSGEAAIPLIANFGYSGDSRGLRDLGVDATFGLAAAEVESVRLFADGGSSTARVANGAFLHVGPRLGTGFGRAVAVRRGGQIQAVPLASAPTSDTLRGGTGLAATGPAEVERRVVGGSIRWIERRELRGDPLHGSSLGPVLLDRAGRWFRILQPDPHDFLRIGVSVPDDAPDELCVFFFTRGTASGACGPRRDRFRNGPLSESWEYIGAGRQFLVGSGIATDDVARIELFLATGERRAVALSDNVFVLRALRAKFPVRLVAYDRNGRIIGIRTHPGY